jgi:hypothetical protein
MNYADIQALNWSALRHMAVSPLLYQWRQTHPEPATESMTFGLAVHCALFEPEQFPARYAVFDGTRRRKVWEQWQFEHPGVTSLKPDQMDTVHACADAVRGHRIAGPLLEGYQYEQIITWTDAQSGIACKGRLDVACKHLLDLKTTGQIAPAAFERSSANYLYHGQLAWYLDGAIAAGRLESDAQSYIIAAQSDGPYDVVVYRLPPELLDAGRNLYRALLQRLQDCIAADWWPGAAPDLQTLYLPRWYAQEPESGESIDLGGQA